MSSRIFIQDSATLALIYNYDATGSKILSLSKIEVFDSKIDRNLEEMTSKLSIIYMEDRTRYSMQFIADILKKLNNEGKIKREDLYVLKETEIIDIIENSKYKEVFTKWKKAKQILTSETPPKNVYFVHHGAKIRYIDPLINGERISKINKKAQELINNNLSYNMNKYIYLDFNF